MSRLNLSAFRWLKSVTVTQTCAPFKVSTLLARQQSQPRNGSLLQIHQHCCISSSSKSTDVYSVLASCSVVADEKLSTVEATEENFQKEEDEVEIDVKKESITERLRSLSKSATEPTSTKSMWDSESEYNNTRQSTRGNYSSARAADELQEEIDEEDNVYDDEDNDEEGETIVEAGGVPLVSKDDILEPIVDRLRRLSVSSPQSFVPSPGTKRLPKIMRARYAEINEEYNERFIRRQQQYQRRDNWNSPPRYGRRYFSTSTQFRARDKDNQEEAGVIARLRKLSSQSLNHYEPSEGAQRVRETSKPLNQNYYRNQNRSKYFSNGRSQSHDEFNERGDSKRSFNNYSHNSDSFEQRSNFQAKHRSRSFDSDRQGSQSFGRNSRNAEADWDEDHDEEDGSNKYNSKGRSQSHDRFQEVRDTNKSFKKYSRSNDSFEPRNNFQGKQRSRSFDSNRNGDGCFKKTPNDSAQDYDEDENVLRNSTNEMRVLDRKPRSFGPTGRSKSTKYPAEYLPMSQNSDLQDTQPVYKKRFGKLPSSYDDSIDEGEIEMISWETKRLDLVEQTDPDSFGTLSVGSTPVVDEGGVLTRRAIDVDKKKMSIHAEEEGDDITFLDEQRWSMRKLRLKIKELAKAKKLKEAIDTLQSALKVGGFKFDYFELAYLYNIVISECAKVGYVKMSFKLFNEMKKRGIEPRESVFTSLFNACANSPWDVEDNLERVNKLRGSMKEKGIVINEVHYHSMIKAYGRCGDIESAFAIVDEMITERNIKPSCETFSFLLQACITDTANGFRHLLVTWKKMRKLRIQPNEFSYSLLLRAVRECGIEYLGSSKPENSSIESTIKSTSKQNQTVLLPPVVTDIESKQMMDLICFNNKKQSPWNSIYSSTETDSIVKSDNEFIEALTIPENRLAIFGGIRGIITMMTTDRVEPNLKSITELAQIIHPDESPDLLELMDNYSIKPDIAFFNLLIKKYHYWRADKEALEVIRLFPQYNLTPDIMTWGVMALGCYTWLSAKSMLEEMDDARFLPNAEIMGTLMYKACEAFDPSYVSRIMAETKAREVKPNTKFILKLEEFHETVKQGVLNKELNKEVTPRKLAEALETNPTFEEDWVRIKLHYKPWMKQTEIKDEPNDPWDEDFKRRYSKKLKHSSEEEALAASN